MSELFGDLDSEKTNDNRNERKIIKESKLRKAIPIFEIMAQFTDFKTSFMHLLAPIINTLEHSPSVSKIQSCEDLLSRVSSSLLKNETVKGSQLLLFLYSIIERGIKLSSKIKINDEKESRDYGASLDRSVKFRTKSEMIDKNFGIDMHWVKGKYSIDSKKTQEISGRVLASFGLQSLKKALKTKDIITLELDDKAAELTKEQQK